MRDDETGGISFDADDFPERDRFAVFCEGMFRHVVGADIVQSGSMPFRGVLEVRRVTGVIIANIATTPSEIIRNKRHVNDGDDSMVLGVWRQGLGHVIQGSHENRVDIANGMVLDNGKVGTVRIENTGRFWALTIPRNRIKGVGADVGRLAGAKLNDGQCLRLLTGYLEGTLTQNLDSRPSTELFGNHLVDLACLALAGDGKMRGLEERDGIRAARLAAILRAVSEQLSDPRLSAAVIATQLGITPRYVHILLERSGRTFTQHVLQKRLEEAEARLSGDTDQRRRIADIALEVGFSDLSHFNRAFRRHFGDTPSGRRATRARQRP